VNTGEVRVKGLREMKRAFKEADKNLGKELTKSLKKVAEPVRADAARRAVQEIPTIGHDWSEMRTGVTTQVVYVAPKQRGRRSDLRRPNLASLLMERAMQPALDAHTSDIERELGHMLDEIGRDWAHRG
jgi:hypothetical protein